MRYVVHQRDKGVCAECKTDTDAQRREYEALRRKAKSSLSSNSITAVNQELAAALKRYGVPHSRSWGDWWDADHIVPVIEGGGECSLDNLRTLCLPCHKRVTAELRKRLAAQARDKRAIENDSKGLFADQIGE
jgi:5-methylcytosine-specific restriction enzyme A